VSTPTSTVLAFLIAILLLQIWLLSSAIEAAQGPRPGGLAAAVVSGVCFLGAWSFFRMLR
jgi:uncharacterized membrane protein YhiD involved in acid resistance